MFYTDKSNGQSKRYYRLKFADSYYGELAHYGLHRLAWGGREENSELTGKNRIIYVQQPKKGRKP